MLSIFLYNCLALTLVFALVFYVGLIYYRAPVSRPWHRYLLWLGGLFAIGATGVRWYEAGHAPFTNMYESLHYFIAVTVVVFIYYERKYDLARVAPLLIVFMLAGLLFGKTIDPNPKPLVAALQSVWLEIHVMVIFVGYAAFAISYFTALFYLYVIPHSQKERSWFDSFNLAFFSSLLGTGLAWAVMKIYERSAGGALFPQYYEGKLVAGPTIGGYPGTTIFLLSLALLLFVAVLLGSYRWGAGRSLQMRHLFVAVNLALVPGLAVYYGVKFLLAPALMPEHLVALWIIELVSTLIVALMVIYMVINKHGFLREVLPDARKSDDLTFQLIALGFPFLTGGIVAGAVWANDAWGTYWGWDPKEVWSLITWLVYAAYLHARYSGQWKDEKAMYLAVYGFLAVIFTYFGVSAFLPGLHSYA